MRKRLKSLNRVTLIAFLFGLVLLFTNDANPKVCVIYSLAMAVYYLSAELFDFYLWEAADCRKKQLKED